jgi:hypothetical protein
MAGIPDFHSVLMLSPARQLIRAFYRVFRNFMSPFSSRQGFFGFSSLTQLGR